MHCTYDLDRRLAKLKIFVNSTNRLILMGRLVSEKDCECLRLEELVTGKIVEVTTIWMAQSIGEQKFREIVGV